MTSLYPGLLYGATDWISYGLYGSVKNGEFIMIELIYFVPNNEFETNYSYESDDPEIYEI